jgi:hypothetical protein
MENDRDIHGWRAAYSDLLTIEAHWTQQVRDQQSRIATILSINGFLLSFLGSGAFLAEPSRIGKGPLLMLVGSLILIAAALCSGILALGPAIPISGQSSHLRSGLQRMKEAGMGSPEPWLDPCSVLNVMRPDADDPNVHALCVSLVKSQYQQDGVHILQQAITRRRVWMYRQLMLLLVGIMLLVNAFIWLAITRLLS